MKFSQLSPLALFGLAVASPIDRTIEERAAVTGACQIGYASTNGGTTGGSGGSTTTVSSLAQFTAAAQAEGAGVIYVSGQLSGVSRVRIASDKSIIGKSGASLTGIALLVKNQSNVIIRNLAIKKVQAAAGDCIGIQASKNVWVDHVDLSSDRDHGKDYYDGLLDITHASDWITVSNSAFHDHYKASLVGHSDTNAAEDTGHLHVTYAGNYWYNVGSRGPSLRFGTAHVFNSYFNNIETSGINTRMGAKVLVESTAFENTKNAITSQDSKKTGTAVVKDVSLGGSTNTAPKGTAFSVPYKYTLVGSGKAKSTVCSTAGNTLTI